jgi:NACHT domain-containing protein
VIVNWTDVLDLEIANAAWAVAGMVVKPRAGHRTRAALDTVAWADTERLIRDALAEVAASPDVPVLSDDEAAEVATALKRHEFQGSLQALLAARLTDAPETDAAKAREAVRLALRNASPLYNLKSLAESALRSEAPFAAPPGSGDFPPGVMDPLATWLSEHFDEKICALVAMVEGRVGFAGLAQVRAEAYSARIVALLGAIDRQVAALAHQGRGMHDESQFIDRYRRQAHRQHGFLIPPDFDRRRRVPVSDIYVSNGISYVPAEPREEDYSARAWPSPQPTPDSLRVWDLVGRLDRTVLLGDPGGGKSTAANVLMDYFADDSARKIPFLVTLREYAARTPIERSVAEYIEQNLRTLYQSHAPSGLVERLLSTGRAVVIFDGLDELLDTSHRRAVSDRVEQFCSAYPLTPVLVTSRVVGYDQARLDDTQFTCYRLGGFGDDDVAEYAGKWFTTQEGVSAAEAEVKANAFLVESANAEDLRTNPLLLSLMCILYRGAGSLPRDRAGVYARCAELLLRKWDQQRDLYRKLGSDHLVEPTLRYLAWWLFTRAESLTSATERELITKTAEFVYDRGYESEVDAQSAARDFIEFCCGRMWVFSDAGTTADGERLYAFTHRTFMEYFAAWYLAATSDTPENLAQKLVEHAGSGTWNLVIELAMQIKIQSTDRGADRIYSSLLDQHIDEVFHWVRLIELLVNCLGSTRPSPTTVRRLTDDIFNCMIINWDNNDLTVPLRGALTDVGAPYWSTVSDELGKLIAKLIAEPDPPSRRRGLEFLFFLTNENESAKDSFDLWTREQISRHKKQISIEAAASSELRLTALRARAISLDEALAMPGGLSALNNYMNWYLYDDMVNRYLKDQSSSPPRGEAGQLASIGRYLIRNPGVPWTSSRLRKVSGWSMDELDNAQENLLSLDEISGLGFAALLAIHNEISRVSRPRVDLSEIPMPPDFRKLFQDWAEGLTDFVEIIDG